MFNLIIMIQEIFKSLIKDDIEETSKLVGDIIINLQKNIDNNNIAGLIPLLTSVTANSILFNLTNSKFILERLKKEEGEIGLKLSKTCFLFRKYYTRKLKKVSKEIFEIKKNISLNKWDFISLVYAAQEIINNKEEETKNE